MCTPMPHAQPPEQWPIRWTPEKQTHSGPFPHSNQLHTGSLSHALQMDRFHATNIKSENQQLHTGEAGRALDDPVAQWAGV